MTPALPRLLQDFAPAAGVIKADYADFFVEELPLYPADGAGPHTFFLIEKTGLSTLQAVADVARALNVKRMAVGFAGMKDARAVTRQWLSVEHVAPDAVKAIEVPRLRVLEATRHRNKLRLGHLRGNRFVVKVRQADPNRLAELQDALATLTRVGVPNYFGQQRFGERGDTWAVGRALVCGDPAGALDALLGRPAPTDSPKLRQARERYEAGRYAEATRLWPAMFRDERRALRALARTGGHKPHALRAIDRRAREFYVSACQSYLFNQVVAARLPHGLHRLWSGDLAWIHPLGPVFRVEDAAAEQPRADRFEISPTGPLFGRRLTRPTGEAAELEDRVLAAEGLSPDAFTAGPARAAGSRRPLRFQPAGASIRLAADERGTYLELAFTLPRGCYATTLLRELFALETPARQSGLFRETEAEVE